MPDRSFKKRKIQPEPESFTKQALFFILALVPAFLLGILLIFMTNKATQEYKENYDPGDYYYTQDKKFAQSDGYWQYLQQLESIKAQEESLQKESKGAIEKIGQEWKDQKEQFRIQQEQQKLEQQRIKSLLQQFKNR